MVVYASLNNKNQKIFCEEVILVLARTVHAFLEDKKISGAVRKLGEKEYYFRIDTQKLSAPLKSECWLFLQTDSLFISSK